MLHKFTGNKIVFKDVVMPPAAGKFARTSWHINYCCYNAKCESWPKFNAKKICFGQNFAGYK
jgi:hypothetical protein